LWGAVRFEAAMDEWKFPIARDFHRLIGKLAILWWAKTGRYGSKKLTRLKYIAGTPRANLVVEPAWSKRTERGRYQNKIKPPSPSVGLPPNLIIAALLSQSGCFTTHKSYSLPLSKQGKHVSMSW
jgi:hypothetical protein